MRQFRRSQFSSAALGLALAVPASAAAEMPLTTTKALRVDRDNLWLSWAPDSLRGAYYCHLITPEHMRRIMLGEVAVAPR